MNDSKVLTLRNPVEIRESEILNKYLEKRVTNIEKSVNSLTKEFVGYARRTAKLRNNGDEISSILHKYILNQEFNDSSNECLGRFSDYLSVIEDLRNTELDRIKFHVIQPLMDCSNHLKNVKKEIKKDFAARKKEIAAYGKLEKSQQLGNSMTQNEAKARVNSQMAKLEATKQSEQLGKTVISFEKQKLDTFQNVLRSFVHIEMLWHMRALERYTEAYKSLNGIDTLGDQNQFIDSINKNHFKDFLNQSTTSLNMAGRRSQSMTNLKTTNSSSQGDLSNKNELRNSVTFEDQHTRSRSLQNPNTNAAAGGSIMRPGTSQTNVNQSKPPVANGHANPAHGNSSDEDEYTDDSASYTDDEEFGTSRTASARSSNRNANQPVPAKRTK